MSVFYLIFAEEIINIKQKTIMIYFLLAVYFLSAFLMWRYTHLAHSKDGIFNHIEPDVTNLFLTFYPLVNTASCFIFWLTNYPIKGERRIIDLNKFFNIKL